MTIVLLNHNTSRTCLLLRHHQVWRHIAISSSSKLDHDQIKLITYWRSKYFITEIIQTQNLFELFKFLNCGFMHFYPLGRDPLAKRALQIFLTLFLLLSYTYCHVSLSCVKYCQCFYFSFTWFVHYWQNIECPAYNIFWGFFF